MLTKKDLVAIQTMFEKSETGILKAVGKMIQINTDQVAELITVGFNTQHASFTDHEHRITRLEKTTFKNN